jgi:hypothetical protein
MEGQRFNIAGSVFSQINGVGDSNPNLGGVMSTNPTSDINSQLTETEAGAKGLNDQYKNTRGREYADPASSSNTELKNLRSIERIDAADTKDVETNFKPVSEVQGDQIVTNLGESQTEHSRESSSTGQSWLQRQAMKRINRAVADSTSNIAENDSTGAKDPATAITDSKKPGVGKVPAIDQTRPSPTYPDVQPTPNMTPPSPQARNIQSPSIKMPKFSMPRMKLR